MKTTLLLLATLMGSVNGFMVKHHGRATNTARSLASSAVVQDPNDENAYRYLLSKARECAFSDHANSLDAKRYLVGILELEGRCMSGSLAGHDLCDNVDELAEIVAHLREKADHSPIGEDEVSAMETIGVLVGFSLLFAVLIENQWKHPIQPFTLQEWIWSFQGGYMDTMVAHFMRNGGV